MLRLGTEENPKLKYSVANGLEVTGKITATELYIGDSANKLTFSNGIFSVGETEINNDVIGGTNLFPRRAAIVQNYYNDSAIISGTAITTRAGWYLTIPKWKASDKNKRTTFSSKDFFSDAIQDGEYYTLSFNCLASEQNTILYCDFWPEPTQSNPNNPGYIGYWGQRSVNVTQVSKRITLTGKLEVNNSPNTFHLRFWRMENDTNAEITIWDIKLEKGNKATDWSAAPEEIIGTRIELDANAGTLDLKADSNLNILGGNINVSSKGKININSDGVFTIDSENFIINSAATDTDSILELKQDEDIKLKYSVENGLEVKGQIIATSGSFADWEIKSDTSGSYIGGSKLTQGNNYKVGLRSTSKNGYDVAIWAGCTEKRPTSNDAPFRVKFDGSVIASQLTIFDNNTSNDTTNALTIVSVPVYASGETKKQTTDSSTQYYMWAGKMSEGKENIPGHCNFRITTDGSVYANNIFLKNSEGTAHINLTDKLRTLSNQNYAITSYTDTSITLNDGATLNFNNSSSVDAGWDAACGENGIPEYNEETPTVFYAKWPQKNKGSLTKGYTLGVDLNYSATDNKITGNAYVFDGSANVALYNIGSMKDSQTIYSKIYEAGWKAAYGKCGVSGKNAVLTGKWPASTPINGTDGQDIINFTMSADSWNTSTNKAIVSLKDDNNISYATLTVDASSRYKAGWEAAYGKCGIKGSGATLTGKWPASTPTAGTNGQDIITLTMSASNWDTSTNKATVNLKDSKDIAYATLIVDASSRYKAGWGDAYKKVSAPGAGTSNSMTCKWPNSTTGSQFEKTYTLSEGSWNTTTNKIIVSLKEGNSTYAAYTVDASSRFKAGQESVDTAAYYESGYSKAVKTLSITPSGSTEVSTGTIAVKVGDENIGYFNSKDILVGVTLSSTYVKAKNYYQVTAVVKAKVGSGSQIVLCAKSTNVSAQPPQ